MNTTVINTPAQVSEILASGGKLLLATAKRMGYKFVRLGEWNRDVNDKHVKELVKRGLVCPFLDPIKVIPANVYFQFYPERQIKLDENEVLTKGSEGLESYLVILDGQHREAAEEILVKFPMSYKPSLLVEYAYLPEGITPDKWMVEINNTGCNWKSSDRTKSIINILPDEESNIRVAAEWQEKYGMGERCAYAILNQEDTYRKSQQVDFMDDPTKGLPAVLKGTAEKREIGNQLLHAFEVGFRHQSKMLKNMTAIKLVIEVLGRSTGARRAKLLENLLLFFHSIDSTAVDSISDAPSSGKGSKDILLRKTWMRFKTQLNTPEALNEAKEKAMKAEKEWSEVNGR